MPALMGLAILTTKHHASPEIIQNNPTASIHAARKAFKFRFEKKKDGGDNLTLT